jgi:hypothetical protein
MSGLSNAVTVIGSVCFPRLTWRVSVPKSEVPRCQMHKHAASDMEKKLGASQPHSSQAVWIHSSYRRFEETFISSVVCSQF